MRNRYDTDPSTLLLRRLVREEYERAFRKRLWYIMLLMIAVLGVVIFMTVLADMKGARCTKLPSVTPATGSCNGNLFYMRELSSTTTITLPSLLDSRNSVKRLIPPQRIGE